MAKAEVGLSAKDVHDLRMELRSKNAELKGMARQAKAQGLATEREYYACAATVRWALHRLLMYQHWAGDRLQRKDMAAVALDEIQAGKRDPTLSEIFKLSDDLDVAPEVLIGIAHRLHRVPRRQSNEPERDSRNGGHS